MIKKLTSSRSIEVCTPELRTMWMAVSQTFNPATPRTKIILTSTLRSNEEQEVLYMQGRSTALAINKRRELYGMNLISLREAKLIVTNAKPGESKHNPNKDGLSEALDIGFVTDGVLNWNPTLFKQFAVLAKRFENIEWGGEWKFKDLPHFQTRRLS